MIFKFRIVLFIIISILSVTSCAVHNYSVKTEINPVDTTAVKPVVEPPHYLVRPSSSFDLPKWLDLSEITSNKNELFVIGISDPHLDYQTAYNQALMRTKSMTSLLVSSQIRDCKEVFSKTDDQPHQEGNAAKFTRFQIIKSQLRFNESQFQLIDSTTTKYGEKVLLMKFTYDTSNYDLNQNIETSIGVMLSEYKLRNKYQENEVFDYSYQYSSPTINESAIYKLYKVDETSEIISTVNEDTLTFKTDYFKYLLHEPSQVPEYPVKTKLYYGLWKAVLESVATQFSNYYVDQAIANQSVNDTYGYLSQSIDKQTHNLIFSGKIIHIFISENELTLQLEKENP